MNSGQDKVHDHTREQLSALFDGELALDQARFLQRRLQHDAALAASVSRWQLIGDVLRGQAAAPAPDGFSARVADAVAAAAATAPAARRGWARLGWAPGAALAASVALVAFFATRQSPLPAPAGEAPATEVAQAAVPAPATPAPQPAPAQPQAPDTQAAQLAAAVVVAEVPRRAVARRTPASRGQAQRAAATRAARAAEAPAQPQYAVAGAAPAEPVLHAVAAADAPTPGADADNPFAPPALPAQSAPSRPWPRALLPNPGSVFNVGYGNLQPASPPPGANPFRPRVVAGARAPDADAAEPADAAFPSERSSTDE